jgi:hypothetical protein
MKRISSLMNFAVLFSLLSLGSQAHAAAWVDFSSTESVIDIASDDASTGDTTEFTVLLEVTLTCPRDGHLVATGTAEFETGGDVHAPNNIFYDIAKDKAEINFETAYRMQIDLDIDTPRILVRQPDGSTVEDEERSVSLISFTTNWNLPGSIQRIFDCEKDNEHTFYFVASSIRAGDPFMAKAHRPKLVVEFFDKKI